MTKKIILIMNHVQAGMGSDENAFLPPSGKKTVIGPGQTLAPMFAEQNVEISATLFCGDQYYLQHPNEVNKKFVGFVKKFGADAVLCGPAMHYPNFGEMCGKLAQCLLEHDIPSAAAMSVENPSTEIFKELIPIIKMPKKGGIGLQTAFQNMALLVSKMANSEDITELKEKICF